LCHSPHATDAIIHGRGWHVIVSMVCCLTHRLLNMLVAMVGEGGALSQW